MVLLAEFFLKDLSFYSEEALTLVPRQLALKFTPVARMSIPVLLNIDIRSLFTKMSDLSLELQPRIHVHSCAICTE